MRRARSRRSSPSAPATARRGRGRCSASEAGMDDAVLEAWRRHLGDDVEPDALRERLAAGTLGECFAAVAAERGERPALEIDGVALTHGELDDRAARLA